MNIGIACLKFKQGGGTERYVLDLINGFHKTQVKPTVYSTHFEKSLPEYKWVNPKETKLSWVPKKLRLPFLSRFVKKKRANNEIILAATHILADIIICGGQHKGYLNALQKRPSLLEKFKIWYEQRCFSRCKKIIAHSKLMKEELINLYSINPDNIEVIYPPIDTEKFRTISHNERQALRQSLGFSKDDIVYLFPSTGHQRKGFDLLKTFFEQSDLPIKLVVAGTPVTPSKNIISLGFRNDMPQLYQAADFTIMASNYEPFGLVGVESILSGTPIVFSENMACLEVCQNNFGFTFDRENTTSLAKAITDSIQSVQKGNSRITEPYLALNYDPALSTHIALLQQTISTLKNHSIN